MAKYGSPEQAIDSEIELESINGFLAQRRNEFIKDNPQRYEEVTLKHGIVKNAFTNLALFDKVTNSLVVFAGFTTEQFEIPRIVSEKFKRMEIALGNIAQSEQQGSGKVVILGYYPVTGTADIVGAIIGEVNFVGLVSSLNRNCNNIGLMITRLSPASRFTEQTLGILSRLTNRMGRNNSITLGPEKMVVRHIGELIERTLTLK
jgi:hypothetical protein